MSTGHILFWLVIIVFGILVAAIVLLLLTGLCFGIYELWKYPHQEEHILELMSDGKERCTQEIIDELGEKISGTSAYHIVPRLHEQGHLVVSRVEKLTSLGGNNEKLPYNRRYYTINVSGRRRRALLASQRKHTLADAPKPHTA